MLDHILRQVQSYEQSHGVPPNVVFISAQHLQRLQELHPGLFDDDPLVQLGFRFIVVAREEAIHPRAGWLPDRRQHGERAA